MAQKVDILNTDNLRKGSNFTICFEVWDVNDDPISITGWSLSYAWKVRDSDAAAVLTKTVGSGITIGAWPLNIDPSGTVLGRGYVTLVPADTSSLKARVYTHNLKRTDIGFVGSIIPGEGHPSALVTLRP